MAEEYCSAKRNGVAVRRRPIGVRCVGVWISSGLENRFLLGYFAGSSGNSLPTFPGNLPHLEGSVENWTWIVPKRR